MSAELANTLVAGLGNIGFSDEGFGIRVIQALQQIELPEDVDLFEGTGESDLLKAISNRQSVFLVDTLETKGQPGDMIQLFPEDFLGEHSPKMLHHADLPKTLALAYLKGCAPQRVQVFGVVPINSNPGQELSEAVRQHIPHVINAVLESITDNRS